MPTYFSSLSQLRECKVGVPSLSGSHRRLLLLVLAFIGSAFPFAALCSATVTAAPVFSLASGTYTSPQTLTISDATSGAVIYYTTNGSTPTVQSTPYAGPISLPGPGSSQVFQAVALASGYSLSAVTKATIAISLTTATPIASVATGTYASAQSIILTDATPNAVIYYTINGSGPTTSSPVYSGPITLSSNSYIMAKAMAPGYILSGSLTNTYSFVASPPAISPASGTYQSVQSVTLSSSTPGAGFYYTIDGSTPTTSSSWYSSPIKVSSNETVQAITWASKYNTSGVSSASYTIQLPAAAPTFSPAAGTYNSTQTVSIKCSNTNAVIYYTTNGSAPTASSAVYSGPVTVSSNETLSAIALASGGSNSPVSQAGYTITPPATAPVYSPAAGGYGAVQTVTLSDATSGAAIYYTTNGSTPTAQSTVYTGPITVSASTNFQATALAPGGSLSPVTKAWYTITLPAATPVISPTPGTYNIIQSVTLNTSTPNATIYYTLDGSYPSTSSPVYTGPITATTNTSIIATASAPSYNTSAAVRASYIIVAPPPSIVPQLGTPGAATVTMADAVPGAVIYYTSNGSIPTTSSAVYNGPITVSPQETATQVYYAIAVANGYLQSSPTMVTFTVNLPSGVLAQATVSSTPSFTIPPNFLGLSMLYNFPSQIMGQASTGANLPYRTLVNNLEQYSTAPILIRLLGDDTQTSNIQADVEPLVEFSQAVNANYILGVDLWYNDVTIAEAEASTWMNGIPNSLIQAFEIGNEPDVYPVNGARPSPFVFSDYLPQYQQWVQGVQAATGGSFGIVGPSFGYEDKFVRTTWVASAQNALASGAIAPTIVSQHSYVTGPGTYPADYLLLPDAAHNMVTKFQSYAISAHQAGSLFRLGEMNSIWAGGIPGISNTFSAALWSIDTMFNFAKIGIDGVNWHSGQGTAYQLFQFNLNLSGGMTTYTVAQVNPLYYGLLTFAQMAGRGAQLLPVTTTTTANVSIWATVDNTSTAHVVVLNKDEQATGDIQITLPGYTTGTVRYLSAANYSATNGVTLGGQTFDGTPDGTIQGQLITTTIAPQNGLFTLPNMPITSAAIIDFSQ